MNWDDWFQQMPMVTQPPEIEWVTFDVYHRYINGLPLVIENRNLILTPTWEKITIELNSLLYDIETREWDEMCRDVGGEG